MSYSFPNNIFQSFEAHLSVSYSNLLDEADIFQYIDTGHLVDINILVKYL